MIQMTININFVVSIFFEGSLKWPPSLMITAGKDGGYFGFLAYQFLLIIVCTMLKLILKKEIIIHQNLLYSSLHDNVC